MRKSLMGVAAMLVTCLAAAAWAADTKATDNSKTGTIKSVDATAKTFVLSREQRPLTFTVNDKTTFTLDGAASTFAAAVKVDLKTTVTYARNGEARLATKVESVSPEVKK